MMNPEDFLTRDQFKTLLDNARTPMHKALLLLMGDCGMRVSEVACLQAGDVDPLKKWIYVKHGKGDKKRTVVGTEAVFKAIEDLQVREGYLFPGRQSGHISTHAIGYILNEIADRAGLQEVRQGKERQRKKVTAHLLRHSHASWLLDCNVPVSDVQAQLGHVSLATTGLYLLRRPNHRTESFRRCGWI